MKKIKKTLTSDLFLTHYNPDLEIRVASDASSYGVGACILHKMTDGTLKAIAHASRALLPAEKIIRKPKKRFLGLYSQSQSSTSIFTVDTSPCQLTTSHYSPFLVRKRSAYAYRQQRWGTILLNYNSKIEYLPWVK